MGREIRGNAGLHHGNLAPIPATPRRMERERDIYSGGIENFLKKVLENLDIQQMLINFALSLRQRVS